MSMDLYVVCKSTHIDMGRKKDPIWEYMIPSDGGKKWRCRLCSNEYGGTVTRMKFHLAGIRKQGIDICHGINDREREKFRRAIEASRLPDISTRDSESPAESMEGNAISPSIIPQIPSRHTCNHDMPLCPDSRQSAGRMRTVSLGAGPSYADFPLQTHCYDNPISHQGFSGEAELGATSLEFPQATQLQNARRTHDVPLEGQGHSSCSLVGQNMRTLRRKLEEFICSREADIDELESRWKKVKSIKGEYWSVVQAMREGRSLPLQHVARVEQLIKEVEEIQFRGSFCSMSGSTIAAGAVCDRTAPLMTTKLVGETSWVMVDEICDFLMKDEISIIGIYGMGGVGKTAISMHVHNRLLENPAFKDVFWVTVPHNLSVYDLQIEIANMVNLDDLLKEKNVKKRASMLSRHLATKKTSVLILDGLLTHFMLEDVGISVGAGRIKLVLTTRSLDVCRRMLCQKHIYIKPLWPDEAWTLFSRTNMTNPDLPTEVEQIAKLVVGKCEGLPLAIVEIATSMRGVENAHEWQDVLQKLGDSKMELEMFERLKLSYLNLVDHQVRQCFLVCVLYCSGEFISREDLIECFIDEGLVGGIASREKLHNQCNAILNKLENACILEKQSTLGKRIVKMHPLIRDMGLHVMNTAYMVKAKMELVDIPGREFWTSGLEKASLAGNKLREIPPDMSPDCPKLTTLLLNYNESLRMIPDSFFMYLHGLKVLKLSGCGIAKLPNSFSDLVNLTALLLSWCSELRRIPYVGKLISLRKLDLIGCQVLEEVPEGLEMLVNLQYLDLLYTEIETLPEGMLATLANLQHLKIQEVNAEDVTELKMLATLHCSFPNIEAFNTYASFVGLNSPHDYLLKVNGEEQDDNNDVNHERRVVVGSCNHITAGTRGRSSDGCVLLPKNVQELIVRNCSGMTNLCDIGPLEDLEVLYIIRWDNLRVLSGGPDEGILIHNSTTSFPYSCSTPLHLPRLQRLSIRGCPKLKKVFGGMLEVKFSLPNLCEISLYGCDELEGITAVALPGAFPSLQKITASSCPKMKNLLESEFLAHLPNLKEIRVHNCEKMEEIIAGPSLSIPLNAFLHLSFLEIQFCCNIRKLFTLESSLHLPNLQWIRVESCEAMEDIICGGREHGGASPNVACSSFPFPLPKLKSLHLLDLPLLQNISDGTLSCDSIEKIVVYRCPMLRRIPLHLPRLNNNDQLPSAPPSLQVISMDDEERWESLEWDNPHAKSLLQPLVRFWPRTSIM
ncbi:disease resistance protein SUMM2-like isoform X3 [Syzygium oleosum]|uniref:disease resistance protein SUMM2-like isoform X3 n=1 Tax=Syzygium oleosum TaxID=219896 RepID=UPI0024B93D8B|nr:disease resistance protein SUMM2-like isoform X3 [Syzygium oleosum]